MTDITKKEVLKRLTKLYDACVEASEHSDDDWLDMALAISAAEDVAHKAVRWDQTHD